MGLDLGATVNAAADWLCSAPIVRGIVSNPFLTALLIVALVAVVIMGLYCYQIKRAGAKRAVRAFVYIFLLVTAVAFVHHYAVTRCARQASAQKGVRDVFTSIEQSRGSGAGTPVVLMGREAPASAVGGGQADCGCPPTGGQGERGARGARPDNVAPDDGLAGLVIEDVVVPAAASPFGATA